MPTKEEILKLVKDNDVEFIRFPVKPYKNVTLL